MDDVEDIYEKVGSYMRIVKKTACDMVPKAITLFIIRNLQEFIQNDLLTESVLEKLENEDNDVSIFYSTQCESRGMNIRYFILSNFVF